MKSIHNAASNFQEDCILERKKKQKNLYRRLLTMLVTALLITSAISPVWAVNVTDTGAANIPAAGKSEASTTTTTKTNASKPSETESTEDSKTEADKTTDKESKKNAPKENVQQATIMLTGDLMCQPMQQLAAYDGSTYDFKPTFQYVKKIFDTADLVIGNLETLVSKSLPLSKDMSSLQTKPYLNAPEEFLDALKYAGFDGFITANNHDCDGGETGLWETLDALDARKIPHTGTFKDENEQRYMLFERNGIKIGILSYATYFNKKEKFLSVEKQAYMLNRLDTDAVQRDIKALRDAGAEYIIAYNHSGTEYSQVPAARQERYAILLGSAGVDYVVTSHPHVLQPYEKLPIGDKYVPVIYSMGNFTSAMLSSITKETLVLSLTLSKDKNGKVSLKEQTYYPCYMLDEYENEPFVLMPEDNCFNGDFEQTASEKLKKQLAKNYAHIRKIVGKLH